ncbi:MAG: GNAT family N-acetyltransferase [Flavobacterium sp.]|nr:GNAT family N-acetyltransferase [Flavobacterium sp.]
MKYTIVPFSEQNIAHFPVLYRAVYGKEIALEHVTRKFDTKYLIDGFFGFFAYDGSKPIAFYGAIPVQMCYKNKTEIAAQSVNTMTHPDYRGKGLFIKLAKMTYEKMAEAGIRFVWGFPNQHSEPTFLNKLDWEYQHRLEGYVIKIQRNYIRRVLNKIPSLKTEYIDNAEKLFLPYKTENASRPIATEAVTVFHTKEYYDYKSFSGNFAIQIEGCCFFINLKNGCWIGSASATDEAEFRQSFQKFKKLCQKARISEIMIQTSPGTILSDLMKSEKTFQFESWIAGYKNFNSNFPLEKLQFSLGDADVF